MSIYPWFKRKVKPSVLVKRHVIRNTNLESGIFSILLILPKKLKEKIYFSDILVCLGISWLVKWLVINYFNIQLDTYTYYMIIAIIFSTTYYIMGYILKEMDLARNITQKNFTSYMFYKFVLKSFCFFITSDPIIILASWLSSWLFFDFKSISHVLPSGTQEVSENLQEVTINKRKLSELVKVAKGKSFLQDAINAGDELMSFRRDIESGVMNANSPVVYKNLEYLQVNYLLNLRRAKYFAPSLFQLEEQIWKFVPHISSHNKLINDIDLDNKGLLIYDILKVEVQLAGLSNFKAAYDSDFVTLSTQVAADYKSKLNLGNLSDFHVTVVVQTNANLYKDSTTEAIGTNIARGLGYERLGNIRFRN